MAGVNLARWPALLLAYLFLAMAIVGVVLPGLPTVPFLLLSAWFAARGSKRLHQWLYAHPHFGRVLIDWEQQGAISRRSKVIAVAMLVASWVVMFFRIEQPLVMVGMTLLFLALTAFLLSRPEPASIGQSESHKAIR